MEAVLVVGWRGRRCSRLRVKVWSFDFYGGGGLLAGILVFPSDDRRGWRVGFSFLVWYWWSEHFYLLCVVFLTQSFKVIDNSISCPSTAMKYGDIPDNLVCGLMVYRFPYLWFRYFHCVIHLWYAEVVG